MDWLVIFGTIIVILPIVVRMKKRVPLPELYVTAVFSLFVQTLVDTYASFEYEAWGFFEVNRAEFKALWIIVGIYPLFAMMIANWYPYRARLWLRFVYLAAWALFSTGYEWVSVQVGIIWHGHWNLLYSLLLYPVIYWLLPLHVRFYNWLRAVA